MSNKRTASMAVIGNGSSPADTDHDDSMTDGGQHTPAANGINGSAAAANNNSVPHVHDDKMDELVLSYLSKRGYMRAAEQFRSEIQYNQPLALLSDEHTTLSKQQQNPLTDTDIGEIALDLGLDVHTHLLKQIVSYNVHQQSPEHSMYQYEALKSWIHSSIDAYKYELLPMLWPFYVHIFIDLISKSFSTDAHRFLVRYRSDHDGQHGNEILQLSNIWEEGQLRSNELIQLFIRRKVEINMSAFTHQLLISYIEERNFLYLLKLLNTYTHIKIISRKPIRQELNDIQVQIQSTVGAAQRVMSRQLHAPKSNEAQRIKHAIEQEERKLIQTYIDGQYHLNWGTLQDYNDLYIQARQQLAREKLQQLHTRREQNVEQQQQLVEHKQQLQAIIAEDEQHAASGADDRSHRHKQRREKERRDLEAKINEIQDQYKTEEERISRMIDSVIPLPQHVVSRNDQLPLPTLKEEEKQQYIENLHSRARLSREHLPSVCLYTFLNSQQMLIQIVVSDDGKLVIGCYSDSTARLWNLDSKQASGAVGEKGSVEYQQTTIDANGTAPDSKQSSTHTLDDFTHSDWPYWLMTGHSGPIYTAAFSPDSQYVLTGSEDATIRLWHIPTRTNPVVYKGHQYPIWNLTFSPLGFYFASAAHDKTARLWSTDKMYPLRIFVGHLLDVDVVKFHPNSNYLCSGSSDNTIRMWDIQTGECIRLFTGHTAPICCIDVSPDGRQMCSGGEDGKVILYDLQSSRIVTEWSAKTLPLPEVDISTAAITGKVPESSGVLYHTKPVTSVAYSADGQIIASGSLDCTIKLWNPKRAGDKAHLRTLRTNSTPVTGLKFTPRNVLLATGIFTTNG